MTYQRHGYTTSHTGTIGSQKTCPRRSVNCPGTGRTLRGGSDMGTVPRRKRDEPWIEWARALISVDPSGCWRWKGTHHKNGRPTCTLDGEKKWAYRVMYEQTVGPIPDGLTIDHVCRNCWCMNPAHLDPVTPKENIRRYFESLRKRGETHPMVLARWGGGRTHCPKGHELVGENTYPEGHRLAGHCRACNLATYARYRAKRTATRQTGMQPAGRVSV